MKNDWIFWVVGGVVALAAVGYTALIPVEDRNMLATKFLNRPKWDAILAECRTECKTTHLRCVDPCMSKKINNL